MKSLLLDTTVKPRLTLEMKWLPMPLRSSNCFIFIMSENYKIMNAL